MKEGPPEAATAETRRLAAIMFTDIVGFSHQMGADEARTLRLLAIHNQLIEQAVAVHQGHIIKTTGDGFLVDFPSVVHAVQCAQRIQAQFRDHNAEQDKAEQIHIRIGIHLGDIVVQPNGDVLGDGVNIASRLQTLAAPDTICISQKVYEEVEKKIPLGAVISLGRPKLKNIDPRFQIYALLPEQPKGLRQTLRVQGLKLKQKKRALQTAAVVLMLGLASAGTLVIRNLYFSSSPGLPLPDKPSIAVLPFTNMSSDPEQEHFSDGMTEDLITDLSKLSGLFVISRNTVFTYKGKAVKVPTVSKELGVRYVLEGSVRKVGDQVRITTQLVDAATDSHLWAERYDRSLKDIFALQDEIKQKIVTTLKLQLSLWEQGHLVRKRTDNLEAYDYYLRGMVFFWRLTKEANAQARQMYEKALVLDPQYAEAYACLGWTYFLEWAWRWSPDPQNLERAFALIQRAIALDDSLPNAHTMLGPVYLRKKQFDQALAEAERAIALDPNMADSYVWLAVILNATGRSEEALRSVEKALRLNPRYPFWYLNPLGLIYRVTGRYEEAITALKTLLTRNPNFIPAYGQLAACYVLQWFFQLSQDPQTLEQALTISQKAIALNDFAPWSHATLGFVYLFQKQYEQASAEMERTIALEPNFAWGYAFLADVLSNVGRPEEAIGLVEKAMRLDPPPYADEYSNSLGLAYYLAGRYEEAIAPLKRYLVRYPNFLAAHLTLAAVYSELGKEAEAQAEAAEVLRINPNFSLEVHRQRVPIKDPAVLERQLAALRKAGLK